MALYKFTILLKDSHITYCIFFSKVGHAIANKSDSEPKQHSSFASRGVWFQVYYNNWQLKKKNLRFSSYHDLQDLYFYTQRQHDPSTLLRYLKANSNKVKMSLLFFIQLTFLTVYKVLKKVAYTYCEEAPWSLYASVLTANFFLCACVYSVAVSACQQHVGKRKAKGFKKDECVMWLSSALCRWVMHQAWTTFK